MAFSNGDVIAELINQNGGYMNQDGSKTHAPKSISQVLSQAKQVYNTPQKGILWGWEVSAYIWTKAIAAGMILVPILGFVLGFQPAKFLWSAGAIVALVFLTLTGLLLIMDLDQPKRFLYVLLRPQWDSWLVKGGYAITLYGGLLTLMLVSQYFFEFSPLSWLTLGTGLTAIVVAVYTAFLFAQSKGRDFWQSPTLVLHMLTHSVMAGAAIYYLIALVTQTGDDWLHFLRTASVIAIVVNLLTMYVELTLTHPTQDAKSVVDMITKGRYRLRFWFMVILVGNILPLALLCFSGEPLVGSLVGILLLTGIYFNNDIWVEAPQRIALS